MTLQQIHDKAEALAKRYNPQNLAPFPHYNVTADCKDLVIVFTELDDDTISGATLFKDNQFTILINSTKPQTRQHFTLGHELGHYFLHQDALRKAEGIVDADAILDGQGNMLFRTDEPVNDQLEREANNFAASLLMPKQLVLRAWNVTESIEECAKIFKVSVVAMSIRLTQLGVVS